MRTAFLSLLLFTVLPFGVLADTKVGQHCSGATMVSCFIYIDGPIVEGTFRKFDKFLTDERQGDSGSIYLNSRGGSIAEALQIGRLVRENGLDTKVGEVPDFEEISFASEGVCESACAYIFMAGERRSLREGDVLGVHRFFSEGRSIEGGRAQEMSGQLISYMVEMGVDARLFTLASAQASEGMHYVTATEATQYDLVTDEAYSELNLEPYKSGVVAWTRPEGPGAPGNVDQITFLCKGGDPEILFYVQGGASYVEIRSRADNGGQFNPSTGEILPASVSARAAGNDAYYTVSVTPSFTSLLSSTEKVNLTIWYPTIVGGSIGADLAFSEIDQQKLQYTFRNCID